MTASLAPHLIRLVRVQAARYVDGETSSADAFHIIDRAALHPLNGGNGAMLNEAHAEFDRAVSRLVSA